ncbi:MAG TPA: 4Fe-4S dicluster domain-containing protein [Caldisericia bacterium]|nr:4Fe-4S dicluster domain-containing protein [Caldisericia bacterium]HPF49353.1 4Fe-4S dicluster domain-containing protein [Caldisericia bacterium]HPI84429.1 4Fe-4S dicluster domain-containing protein [Caldisericia bacterium]HPQ93810.1 4Fe-4S dicluster domain-containing protein [Caldisericia bacterium]HRV75626.1 4Fe-4S dicluster domain-containing protein [Caldisericia bacterium]
MSDSTKASTISDSRLKPKFKTEVSELFGGERIKSCFQCGTCTASCPVRAVDESYNPRKIIRMVLLGMRDEVLKQEPIWLCTYCYTCQERCPQDVGITDLVFALKNLATKEGYMHPSMVPQVDILSQFGRLYEMTDFDNKKRAKLGLPTLENKQESIDSILDSTGLKDAASKRKGSE